MTFARRVWVGRRNATLVLVEKRIQIWIPSWELNIRAIILIPKILPLPRYPLGNSQQTLGEKQHERMLLFILGLSRKCFRNSVQNCLSSLFLALGINRTALWLTWELQWGFYRMELLGCPALGTLLERFVLIPVQGCLFPVAILLPPPCCTSTEDAAIAIMICGMDPCGSRLPPRVSWDLCG